MIEYAIDKLEDLGLRNLAIMNIEKDEEIERLKEELKYTIPIVEHNQTIQSNINSYNKLAEYSKELEDRIDEAIKYIENDMPYLETPDDDYENNHKMIEYDIKDLLDILKGSDKE